MSRLDSAFERFNKALDRCERALRESDKADSAAGDPKVVALKADRDHLARQLEEARSDYAGLQSVADEVETRLDTAIDNIRKIMRG